MLVHGRVLVRPLHHVEEELLKFRSKTTCPSLIMTDAIAAVPVTRVNAKSAANVGRPTIGSVKHPISQELMFCAPLPRL